ncbi:FGGY-family carbohydrate kinase [Amycolatopsis acidiphila]|uniref:Sugar kinase n=1 Tax=Amycolatopsis acidiphila TaxID=715473 RepID=A0A558A0R1_9PSEU|nr:FGGY-family carbohydrate kinase [Amycolatopsis acidiphila]TVT17850.1 sugar kinase [Amycolatopsis acidiphila]UIJ62241.1 FGGY-family carbohydrate kinase [Amycolatopsis acidiphila]
MSGLVADPAGLLVGIDIGTSSSKGVLVTPAGEIVARASRAHETSYPHPGWVEHDAEKVWWQDFLALSRELADAAAGRPLGGLAVSGIGPVLLPADAAGRPLRPAILYGVDTRADREIVELTEELGADAILERAGTALSSQAVGPKWRWLARHEPEVFERTSLFLMASSYLVHRLTGEYVLDHHSASQCDPMYDLRAGEWAADWAARVAPGVELPRLVWPTEVAGTISAAAAAETGLPQGLPVAGGTVDAWAEAASVGVSEPGDTMVMYGTTMFLIQVLADPRPHTGLWTTCGAFPGTYSLAAGMATSGAITDWLRKLVGGDFADLVRQAADVPAGSRGLLLLPYFAGERTPLFDPDARGMIAGLTTAHGLGELYRAALEGIAYGVRHNLEAMHASGGRAQRLVAVGGGTQGGLWTQIVSDVTGAQQQVPAETIGAAFGDALLAAVAVGTEPREWNPVAGTVRPDPARAAVYEEFYAHYRSLYPSTVDTAHFLAAQQRAADRARA